MGNYCSCFPNKFPHILGTIDEEKSSYEGAYKITVQLQTRKFVHAWVTPTETIAEVNSKIRIAFPDEFTNEILDESIYSGLMMHRFGKTALVEPDVLMWEAKSRHFRYSILGDIGNFENGNNRKPLTFSREFLNKRSISEFHPPVFATVGDEQSMDENTYRVNVKLPTDNFIHVWVHQTETIGQVDLKIRTTIPGQFNNKSLERSRFFGLMMHRFGRSALIDANVSMKEAKSRNFRYTEISDVENYIVKSARDPFAFTREYLHKEKEAKRNEDLNEYYHRDYEPSILEEIYIYGEAYDNNVLEEKFVYDSLHPNFADNYA